MKSVAIIDDNPNDIARFKYLLDSIHGLSWSGSFKCCEEAFAQLPKNRPDVILLDIQLPDVSGDTAVRKLRAILPKTEIVMITRPRGNDSTIFTSLKNGAVGYLSKMDSDEELKRRITEIRKGGAPMSMSIARKVAESFQTKSKSLPTDILTDRELEVLEKLQKGMNYQAIADKLEITKDTVKTHIKHIYEKLHVHSRRDL